jgi:hypothetical protein
MLARGYRGACNATNSIVTDDFTDRFLALRSEHLIDGADLTDLSATTGKLV